MGATRPGMQLRCCARRTGFKSSTRSAKMQKAPDGAFHILAVRRVLCGGCSPEMPYPSGQHPATLLVVNFNCPDIAEEVRRPGITQLISVQWINNESRLIQAH
jgi:hypothetical protein